MNNRPPINEALTEETGRAKPGWANWFGQVFLGLPWKKGMNYTATLDFGSVAAQAQATLTVTVPGARAGDAVQVTTADVSGIVFAGYVTADDTVSVYAKNFSAGAVNPPSQLFRIIVLQN